MSQVDLETEVENASTEEHLRGTIDRLSAQLREAKVKRSVLVDAVYRAASDAADGLVVPPVPKAKKDKRTAHEEVAVVHLSDWQLSKITPTYDTPTAERRILELAEKVEKVVAVQRSDHPVKEVHIWGLGDWVEGELIFPGQQHLIDASLYRQVTVDGPRIALGFIRKMQSLFEKVVFHGVIGNHGAIGGRARRDYDPETNADRMLYRIVQMVADANLSGGSGIEWHIPDGAHDRNWYSIDEIGNFRAVLMHGDQFRGTAGMPWYSMQKKAGGWALGALDEWWVPDLGPIDEIAFGHWHQSTIVTLNSTTGRCNGSTESTNTYAQEQLAAVGVPTQWLTFVNPRAGIVTAEYRLRMTV